MQEGGRALAPLLAAVFLLFSPPAAARDQVRIVGSSTVFPFSAAVAEQLARTRGLRAPVVESTGTGGGMKIFCAGIGPRHPDIVNASRRITPGELESCRARSIGVGEVRIGFDGIVLARSKAGAALALTSRQIFLALAKRVPEAGDLVDNPYRSWNEIDAALPETPIEVLGPPPTSGTRDAFVALAMERGAQAFPELAALRRRDAKAFKAVAHAMREDGAFIEAGEDDNLIVLKLAANPKAVGIFGFSFLDQNLDRLRGLPVDGVAPSYEAIAAGDYPLSRSLYFYVKENHLGRTPGLEAYIAEFAGAAASGEEGYLIDKGLIPLRERRACPGERLCCDGLCKICMASCPAP